MLMRGETFLSLFDDADKYFTEDASPFASGTYANLIKLFGACCETRFVYQLAAIG
jgi:hypothetical protein